MKSFSFPLLCLMAGASLLYAASPEAESAREAARQYGAAVRNCDLTWAIDSMYPPLRRTYADQLGGRNSTEAQRARLFDGADVETIDKTKARRAANEKALRDKYAKMGEAMKQSGMRIESYTVGAPTAEYRVTPPMSMVNAVRKDTEGQVRAENLNANGDWSRIVILPTTLVFSVPAQDGSRVRIERRGFIYAIRDEQITDTGRARATTLKKWYFADGNTGIATMRTFFPDMPAHLDLPPCGDRRL